MMVTALYLLNNCYGIPDMIVIGCARDFFICRLSPTPEKIGLENTEQMFYYSVGGRKK